MPVPTSRPVSRRHIPQAREIETIAAGASGPPIGGRPSRPPWPWVESGRSSSLDSEGVTSPHDAVLLQGSPSPRRLNRSAKTRSSKTFLHPFAASRKIPCGSGYAGLGAAQEHTPRCSLVAHGNLGALKYTRHPFGPACGLGIRPPTHDHGGLEGRPPMGRKPRACPPVICPSPRVPAEPDPSRTRPSACGPAPRVAGTTAPPAGTERA